MKVFISWSGKRSKETAEVLASWIRQVIQAAETWISLDMEKGARWSEQIKNELESSKVGIICLNRENLQSEWILFEAGALSKTQDAHVCTFLLDINAADIKPPLGQFQHTLFIKEDVRRLINTINNKIISNGEKSILDKDLNEVFEMFYPRLEEKLSQIKKKDNADGGIQRTDREILEEMLQIIRSANLGNIEKNMEAIFYEIVGGNFSTVPRFKSYFNARLNNYRDKISNRTLYETYSDEISSKSASEDKSRDEKLDGNE